MARPILNPSRLDSRGKRGTTAPPQSFLKKIASFLGFSPPVSRRPISVRDNFSKNLPQHRSAVIRLDQMTSGVRSPDRPTDVQLTNFLNTITKG